MLVAVSPITVFINVVFYIYCTYNHFHVTRRYAAFARCNNTSVCDESDYDDVANTQMVTSMII